MSLALHGKLLVSGRTVLPSDLGGLVVWVDASKISGVADGVGVTTWSGLVGTTGLGQATEANRPLFRVTGWTLNSGPCVEFDGIAHFMNTAAIGALDSKNTVSAVIVLQEVAFVASNRVMSSQYAGGQAQAADTWGFSTNSATSVASFFRRADATFDSAATTIVGATHHIYALSVDNVVGGISLYRDGGPRVAGPAQTPASPTTHTSTFLGKRSAGQFSNIRVAELAIWSQTHSQINLQRVVRTLARKWGTP